MKRSEKQSFALSCYTIFLPFISFLIRLAIGEIINGNKSKIQKLIKWITIQSHIPIVSNLKKSRAGIDKLCNKNFEGVMNIQNNRIRNVPTIVPAPTHNSKKTRKCQINATIQ
ncbi:MAG: hypothetical protein HUN04_13645 [Desulfobacter sp.]|nr:MAG: hypothetical protein HUN04_13645 [Desulfobacter sp.]